MSYTKITNFAIKDTYLTGNPAKIVKGAEIDAEFDNIATASAIAVEGPASAIDNEIARFDGITGKLIKAGLSYQTSTTDLTGNLMINGAFGIGTSIAPPGGNLNNALFTGNVIASNTTLNTPVPGSWCSVFTSNAATQLATTLWSTSANVLFVRNRQLDNVTWNPWLSVFTSGGVNAVTVDTGSIGFGTGSGSTATQSTSKATGVTLNKPTGVITMNAASLAASTAVSFTLTNSKIGADDNVLVNIKSGIATGGSYALSVDAVAAGSCRVSLRNLTAGALAEAVVFNFNVMKGASA